MAAITLGAAAVAALFATTSDLFMPKIPYYDVSIRYPPLFWFDDNHWSQLKATLHSSISISNKNIIPSNVHAMTFDLFFPTWSNDELIPIAHVEDMYQQRQQQVGDTHDYVVPKEPFWNIQAKKLFHIHDSLILRIPLHGIYQIMSHLLYQATKNMGMLQVVATGSVLLTEPPAQQSKMTLTFVCNAQLNAITSRMMGSDCQILKIMPLWGNITKVSTRLKEYATTKITLTVNGTVPMKGTSNSN